MSEPNGSPDPALSTPHPDPAIERRRRVADRIERASRLPMTLLSVVFLAALTLPELVNLGPGLNATLDGVVWLIWSVFAFELGLMTYLATDRRRYLREHWVDVLTVLAPFLLPVRLLVIVIVSARLWTEAKVLIYQRTFSTVAMTILVSSVAAATLVYAAERGGEGPIQTYPDALWWAAATITTVGYGDVFPKTPTGRGVAVLLMLIGISVFGVLTARVAALFVEAKEDDLLGVKLDEILTRLDRLERELQHRSSLETNRPDADPAAPGPT